ncbi:MAG: RasGEF domain-containing protein, partial [Waddliaceae bacterium]
HMVGLYRWSMTSKELFEKLSQKYNDASPDEKQGIVQFYRGWLEDPSAHSFEFSKGEDSVTIKNTLEQMINRAKEDDLISQQEVNELTKLLAGEENLPIRENLDSEKEGYQEKLDQLMSGQLSEIQRQNLASDFAQDLMALQGKAISSIQLREFLKDGWTKGKKNKEITSPNAVKAVELREKITHYVWMQVLKKDHEPAQRTGMIQFFMQVLNESLKSGDLNTAQGIRDALGHGSVERLESSWENSLKTTMAGYKQRLSHENNFKRIREELSARAKALPFLQKDLKDIYGLNQSSLYDENGDVSPMKEKKYYASFQELKRSRRPFPSTELDVLSDLERVQKHIKDQIESDKKLNDIEDIVYTLSYAIRPRG